MACPRIFLPLAGGASPSVAVPADQAHHLRHVLRLGPGDEVRLFDGAGREWAGRIAAVTKRGVSVERLAEVTPVVEPPVHVTLCMGLLKGDQMDAVVRDATMLGAAAIVPMVSAHVSVPRQAWRGGAAVARWQRIAAASAEQCRRAVVPVVLPVTPFESVVAAADRDLLVICLEPALASAGAGAGTARPRRARLLVGPEGGWSSGEIAEAGRHRAEPLTLGPRTLRAETAPTVALSALWTRWGW